MTRMVTVVVFWMLVAIGMTVSASGQDQAKVVRIQDSIYMVPTVANVYMVTTPAGNVINGAPQPCLIVNDLKLGETHGTIAIWVHWSTNGYFSNLTVRRAVNRK